MRFELIFFYLYDVGRSVDLDALGSSVRGLAPGPTDGEMKRRIDTPESLQLPVPLVLDLAGGLPPVAAGENSVFTSVRFQAKVYEEGVVTIVCRAEADVDLDVLHTLRAPLDGAAAGHFQQVMGRIQRFVNQDQYLFDPANREDYHVFCLVDQEPDPQGFLGRHGDYLAPFLLGENPRASLHPTQIASTLKTPFSFTDQDVAIFDMDRAFFVAPNRDYEDVLLIIEHANYQLLELRALDKLLDRFLDDAERDVRGRAKSGTRKNTSVSQKLGNLQSLRLDALFILENLENSSRIIGDYYLEQIYKHLCGIFNTQGWKSNVERRLEILQSIYTLTKTDKTDSTMVLLELLVAVMIAVELVALAVPLFR